MATITVSATQDGYLSGPPEATFSDARDGSEASSATANPTNTNALSVSFTEEPGRSGTVFRFYRSAFGFNVTSYSSDTITNAKLQIRTTTDGPDFGETLTMTPFAGFGGTLGDSLEIEDWDNFSLGTSWGSAAISNTASTQQLTMNSNVLASFAAGYVKVGLISYVDYTNVDPEAETFDSTYFNWNHSDNAKLIFDQESTGYGNIVNSVPAANIEGIIDVEAAVISSVIGVP